MVHVVRLSPPFGSWVYRDPMTRSEDSVIEVECLEA
jgi:hypothetical protein